MNSCMKKYEIVWIFSRGYLDPIYKRSMKWLMNTIFLLWICMKQYETVWKTMNLILSNFCYVHCASEIHCEVGNLVLTILAHPRSDCDILLALVMDRCPATAYESVAFIQCNWNCRVSFQWFPAEIGCINVTNNTSSCFRPPQNSAIGCFFFVWQLTQT